MNNNFSSVNIISFCDVNGKEEQVRLKTDTPMNLEKERMAFWQFYLSGE